MPYRSAGAALADRERAIERDLQRLLGPEAQEVPRAEHVASLKAELDVVRTALASRNPERRCRRLVIRSQLDCLPQWDLMRGSDRVRACYGCGRRVYNFSGLTSEEAYELLSQHERRPGRRLYRRADGTILAKPCPKRRPSLLPLLLVLIAIMAPIVAWKARARWFENYSETASFRAVLRELEAVQASRDISRELLAMPRVALGRSPPSPSPQPRRIVCGHWR